MTTLSAHEYTPESKMAPRASPPANATQKLTLIATIGGILAMGGGWLVYYTREDTNNQNNRKEVQQIRADFKENMNETREALKETRAVMTQVLQSQAALHSDVLNLGGRVDRLERRP